MLLFGVTSAASAGIWHIVASISTLMQLLDAFIGAFPFSRERSFVQLADVQVVALKGCEVDAA